MQSESNPIVILGPGAIGLSLACKLKAAAYRVYLLGRSANETLKTEVEYQAKRILLEHHAEFQPKTSVMITTRAGDLESAIDRLKANIDMIDNIWLWQNGIGIFDRAKQQLKGSAVKVQRASCYLGAFLENSKLESYGKWFIESHSELPSFPDLADAGFELSVYPNPEIVEWRKAAINLAVNLIATINEIDNCQVWKLHAGELEAICNEYLELVKAAQIPVGYHEQQEIIDIVKNSGANRCSSLISYQKGLPDEMAYTVEPFLSKAYQFGVNTPVITELWQRYRAKIGTS